MTLLTFIAGVHHLIYISIHPKVVTVVSLRNTMSSMINDHKSTLQIQQLQLTAIWEE